MINLLDGAKQHLGLEAGAPLLLPTPEFVKRWGALDDVVMGGVSESGVQLVQGAGEGGGAAMVFRWVVWRFGGALLGTPGMVERCWLHHH
jgi:hypothetical protein